MPPSYSLSVPPPDSRPASLASTAGEPHTQIHQSRSPGGSKGQSFSEDFQEETIRTLQSAKPDGTGDDQTYLDREIKRDPTDQRRLWCYKQPQDQQQQSCDSKNAVGVGYAGAGLILAIAGLSMAVTSNGRTNALKDGEEKLSIAQGELAIREAAMTDYESRMNFQTGNSSTDQSAAAPTSHVPNQ